MGYNTLEPFYRIKKKKLKSFQKLGYLPGGKIIKGK